VSYQPMGNHPTEPYNFFLVRPRGINERHNAPWLPTAVFEEGGELFTEGNEIDPLIWCKGGEVRNGPTSKISEADLEWCPLPHHSTVQEPEAAPYHRSQQFRDLLELEIRLAMQQEPTLRGGVERAAVAQVRAGRIVRELDKLLFIGLPEVPKETIDQISKQLTAR